MVTLINHLVATRGNYLSHVFIAWGIALIPLTVINLVLCSIPLKIYDLQYTCGIMLGNIPIENFFYDLLLMLWMIWVFEFFRQRPAFKAAKTKSG
jgi:hypothetical protein